MFRSLKRFAALFLFVIFSASFVSLAFAEASTSEKSLTGFFRRLFNWGPKTVGEEAKAVGATVSNEAGVLARTGEDAGAVLTGDVSKTGDMLAEPVVGTAQTAGQTVVETAEAPVEAAEEDKSTATQ